MKAERSVWVHGAILLVASATAISVWTRKEPALAAGPERKVMVWPGTVESVQRIEWDGKLKVVLEARQDKVGRFFVGTVEKNVQVLKPTPDSPEGEVDAGPADKPKKETTRFISVQATEKLAESLAPLRAFRSIGKLDESRVSEFGFKDPAGTLKVTVDGKPRSLVLGGATPGGADRYAKEAETGLVYAVSGDLVRTLDFADSRLLERDLHHFEEKEITRARISKNDKVRELVSVEGKKNAWANPGTATQDETAGNWMSKLDTLGISEFVEQPPKPLGPEALVVRVEYFAGNKARGFLELYRYPGEDNKPEYLVRTEYLRWYGKLRKGSADQVEQDLGSLLK